MNGAVPEEHQPFIEQNLFAAWNMAGYAEARRAVERVTVRPIPKVTVVGKCGWYILNRSGKPKMEIRAPHSHAGRDGGNNPNRNPGKILRR